MRLIKVMTFFLMSYTMTLVLINKCFLFTLQKKKKVDIIICARKTQYPITWESGRVAKRLTLWSAKSPFTGSNPVPPSITIYMPGWRNRQTHGT